MKPPAKIFTLKDLFEIAHRQVKGMILIFFVICAIGIFSYVRTRRIYQSDVEIQVASNQEGSGSNQADPVNQVTRPNEGLDLNTQIEVLESAKILTDAYSAAGLPIDNGPDAPVITVGVVGKASVLQINVASPDPNVALNLAAYIPRAYRNYLETMQQAQATKALSFLELRLATVTAQYKQQLDELNKFKLAKGLSSQVNEESALSDQVASATSQVQSAKSNLISEKLKLSTIIASRDQLKATIQSPTIQANTAELEAQRNLITNLKSKLAQMLEVYQPTSTEVQGAMSELKVQEQRLAAMPKEENLSGTTRNPLLLSLKGDIIDANASVKAAQGTYDNAVLNLQKATQALQNYHRIQPNQAQMEQNVALTEAAVAKIKNDIGVVELRRNSAKSPTTRLNGPTPAVKIKPILSQYMILSVLLGILGMVGFAFLKDSLDESFHSAAEVSEVAEALIIGEIPALPQRATALVRKELTIQANEAYASACFSVMDALANLTPAIILVTSCESKEGKSALAMNLALTASIDYDRVLLVDFNPTSDGLPKLVNENSTPGIAQVIDQTALLADCIQPLGEHPISFLPFGREDGPSMGGMSRAKLVALMEELRDRADVVIVEAPPYYSALTKQLVAVADGAVLSCRLGVSKRNAMKRCVDMLRSKDQRILGIVVAEKGGLKAA